MKRRQEADTAVDEPFAQRWSRRKRHARRETRQAAPAEPATPPQLEEPPPLTDADMPPIESLDGDADYSGFLSPEVSDGLRRLALRRLFHSDGFNRCDGLDDYAEAFTGFEKLGEVVTADLRARLQRAWREAGAEAPAEADAGSPGTVVEERTAPPAAAPPEEA